jgi:hypothetical protein
VLPPNVAHGFRVTGTGSFKTLGVHASSHRIVEVRGAGQTGAGVPGVRAEQSNNKG